VKASIRRIRKSLLLAGGLVLMPLPCLSQEPRPGDAPVQRLRVVGGLASVNLYVRHEEPFWTRRLPELSQGRLQAEIVPFDRAGVRGQEMLRLIQLGVVPVGTALLSLASATDAELGAIDLAGLNPDIGTMRRSVAAYRPYLENLLRERYRIEPLAIYVYPAQVTWCRSPFGGLDDLRGRRVRVSSASQADMVEALGAVPVHTGFAEIVPQLSGGTVDCAITGTMSGNTIGLHELTTHVHSMAINWGVLVSAMNAGIWNGLAPDLQALLRRELGRLEQNVWAEAERDTRTGLDCSIGAGTCQGGRKGRMVEVQESPRDVQRRREIFRTVVLQRWIQRCGPACADAWNRTLGPALGIKAPV
jgi:TRAP-type C4-dicarboxylate transport system substrate-binding protein